jgi:hypothetical protein
MPDKQARAGNLIGALISCAIQVYHGKILSVDAHTDMGVILLRILITIGILNV